jgi:hypothetical protein
MATKTAQSKAGQPPETQPERSVRQRLSRFRLPKREALFLTITFAVAAALRLTLAARGWPYSNSDEATLGLMVDDILWHGAHPAFLYGQHYLGVLDAYLQAPFFLMFGPTNLALHITTTIQILLFLALLYLFTRAVYSPLVAGGTLVLLAIAPGQALFFMMRSGAHAQDALLLSTVLLCLTLLRLRLRRPASAWKKQALNLGIGLVVGLGLWSTFLVTPFVVAAGLALGFGAWRSLKATPAKQRDLSWQALIMAAGAIIGLLPFIVATIASGGIGLTEMLQASSGANHTGPGGILGVFFALGQQVSAALLYGLPSMFGSRTVCAGCPIWPSPQSNPTVIQALEVGLIGAFFSLVTIGCWLIAAKPLARDTWRGLRRRRGASAPTSLALVADDTRWWGRMMLVVGGGLTILEYVATRTSYTFPDTSARYLSGIYVCTPLIADPLCRGAQAFWHWLSARRAAVPARPHWRAFLATGLLLALMVINITGTVNAFQDTTNQQRLGVPAGSRDRQLIAFLETHHAAHFYTTYFVCDRLMFDAQEQLDCAVVDNGNAFSPGLNRLPAIAETVQASPHPAYVFDLTTTEVNPAVPQQISRLVASGDPRFAGYASSTFSGYVVFYYSGSGT